MRWSKVLHVVGAHAEGEIGRVVIGGILDIPGKTVQDKLRHIAEVDDSLLRFTLFEPRGAAQMSVNLLLPPTCSQADAAFITLQPDRPHAMSGSNAMCVVTVLLETGMLPMQEPETVITLDTAAGLVRARATCSNGKCERVSLECVPSFATHLDFPLEVEGLGRIAVDVAFGGCYFVLVDASGLGIEILPEQARLLADLGMKIQRAAEEQIGVSHPELSGIDKVEYAMFCAGSGAEIRNGNVIPPGRLDRSPCGTGTAARLSVLHARGEIEVGQRIEARSIIDSAFTAEIVDTVAVGDRPAVIPHLSGRAWIYGHYTLACDPSDPFRDGYTMPDTWGEGATMNFPE